MQLDIFDVTGSLSAQAQINNGVPQSAAVSSGRVRAPLPVAGPHLRVYPWSRLYVDANVLGMYFFGYGNFVSSSGTVGLKLTRHLALAGGYELGSRLNVNTRSERYWPQLDPKRSDRRIGGLLLKLKIANVHGYPPEMVSSSILNQDF